MADGDRARPWRWWMTRFLRAALFAGAVAWMASTPNFLTAGTLSDVLAVGSIVGVLAIGQAFVLIGGGFDLSQGATMGLSAASAAWLAARVPGGGWVAAPAALLLGATLGAINGYFVAVVGTNPFVTTLSTQMLYRGAAFRLLNGTYIKDVTAFGLLERGPEVAGTILPLRSFVFVVAAAASWLVLTKTVFGRHVYAVGGNARAARLSGLPTKRLRIMTFALGGLAAAMAALMQLAWLGTAKTGTGLGYELNSIAACVVGGIALGGGSGSVIGAALGCMLLQGLSMCITMSGFPGEYESLATGAVILTFAGADALARRSDRD